MGACSEAVEAVTAGATACKAAHGVHQGVRTAAEVLAGETAAGVAGSGAGAEVADLGAETGTARQCVAAHPHAVVPHGVAGVDHAVRVVDGPHQGGDHLDVPGNFFTAIIR